MYQYLTDMGKSEQFLVSPIRVRVDVPDIESLPPTKRQRRVSNE